MAENPQNTMIGEEIDGKWGHHYSSLHEILLVGDGDFSFSLSLALTFGSASNIVASSFDSLELVVKKYKKAKSNLHKLRKLGAYILHGVDATKMKLHTDLRKRKFDRIVFNFPHAGFHGKEDCPHIIRKHRNLVNGFFSNACAMLRISGEIHVTHKTTAPYSHWGIEELAYQNSLLLISRVDFNKDDFPGYENKRGDSDRCDEPFPLGDCCTYKFGFCETHLANPGPVSSCSPRTFELAAPTSMVRHWDSYEPAHPSESTVVNYSLHPWSVSFSTIKSISSGGDERRERREEYTLPPKPQVPNLNEQAPVFPQVIPDYIDSVGIRCYNFGGNKLSSILPINKFTSKSSVKFFQKDQQCLLDNLWQAYNHKNNGLMVNTLHALAFYFDKLKETKKFSFYCVIRGDSPGIFKYFADAMHLGVGGCAKPWYKGVHSFDEGIVLLRTHVDANFLVDPNCKLEDDKKQDCHQCNILIKHHNILKLKADEAFGQKAYLEKQIYDLQQRLQIEEMNNKDLKEKYSRLILASKQQPNEGGKTSSIPPS